METDIIQKDLGLKWLVVPRIAIAMTPFHRRKLNSL